jgi:hypothetical protein
MATSIRFEERLEAPCFASRAEYPAWTRSEAHGEEFFFRIHWPGLRAYEPAPIDSEVFHRSAVPKH